MLETEIKKLTEAATRLAVAIENANSGGAAPAATTKEKPAAKEELPEAETEAPDPTVDDTAEEAADTPTVGVTEDDLKALGMQLLKGKKMKEYSEIVKTFGVAKVSELDKKDYVKCHGLLKAEAAKL